ncbi:GNAT family N-acetyltransferase [Streptomyces scabiei]|uniref:GNAT family N-acetyltransferase n=1 Tax=Streptomyces scabiei TaxID=1930 RepID=UPI00062948CA|nr:GNAT family N-acetyltransferase [Streptomyces scabiei]MDX2538393.1 GNAT family N-acetyltransferase [Streptomyces scabiei]MDX2799311.1 GNAT family N-acetyltransferase [Streptomyces scabiei]MDX2836158.1 GNAT family N-acetyltransferase [Streptomyces scabiei]MDX3681029.1 GNAT family N-acetyltransferase [Streptomyces scabiei]MDX3827965.1 GNAT family N-acetyltransferase [Streptomyces scabiei]
MTYPTHLHGGGAPPAPTAVSVLAPGVDPVLAATAVPGPALDNPALDNPVLDNAVWVSLDGPHGRFTERNGRAARYPADVYDFAALAAPADPAAWADLHTLVGAGTVVRIKPVQEVPDRWEVVGGGQGVQLVDTGLRAEPAPEAVRLGPADVPEILDLVARTAPGPFLKRTVELGTCLGIRDRGRLIAMAGERSEMGVPPAGGWGRIHPPGWTEISAVCTDPHHRGRGLATRLVRAVAAGIRDRGETPFLHAAADNVTAIRLYESIGFTLRRRSTTVAVRSPGAPRDRAVRTS